LDGEKREMGISMPDSSQFHAIRLPIPTVDKNPIRKWQANPLPGQLLV
jgi:hypothetical protein